MTENEREISLKREGKKEKWAIKGKGNVILRAAPSQSHYSPTINSHLVLLQVLEKTSQVIKRISLEWLSHGGSLMHINAYHTAKRHALELRVNECTAGKFHVAFKRPRT